MLQEMGWPAVHHDEGAPLRAKNSLFTDYLPITLDVPRNRMARTLFLQQLRKNCFLHAEWPLSSPPAASCRSRCSFGRQQSFQTPYRKSQVLHAVAHFVAVGNRL